MTTKNTDIAMMLQGLDLGSSVAEHDQLLEVARVETSAFSDVLADRVDLVPGTKGSGKSALFRMFVEFLPDYLMRQRKVVVAHGVQALGDSVFHAYSNQFSSLTEEDFIDFWCIYLLSLAHTQFISDARYAPTLSGASSAINRFRQSCVKAGIPEIRAKLTLKDVLGWTLHALSKMRPRLKYGLPGDAGDIELDLLGSPRRQRKLRLRTQLLLRYPAMSERFVTPSRKC